MLEKTLAELSQKLGVSVERLWPELVKYKQTQSVTESCFAVALIIVSSLMLVYAWRGDKDEICKSILYPLFSVALLFGWLMAIETIPAMIYPEPATIKSLLGK